MYNEYSEYNNVSEGAAIPPRPETEATEKIKRNEELIRKTQTRFVFFAANVIDTPIALSVPFAAFGGIYLPHIRTLQTPFNKGMLFQCEITALKPRMAAINRNFLPPGERDGWESSYILENGKFTPGKGYEDVTISDPLGAMVYKLDVLPGNDIKKIVQGFGIGGVRGVVEITALRGKTEAEAREMQLFYFPNWADIQKGAVKLPNTIRELEKHFRSRLDAATLLKDGALIQTGRDMLKSVQLYNEWAKAYLKRIEGSMTAAKNNEFHYEYPYSAELALAQTGSKRKDDLATDGADASRMLVEQMTEQNRLKKEEIALEREKLAFEREKNELEILRLKAQLEIPTQTAAVEAVIETSAGTDDIVACADFNFKGEPCKGKVAKNEDGTLKEINGLFYCPNHPKSE